ncbi:addiction module toxin RelE [Thioalkalivibrio denitrificans]|uniref:Addiction module toxin RelE n=1 Tax=Thioalkalivibrio denitrificans TaxID=108003 RepID=A0A1V3N8U7_9GAMM|nr:type II toxin-antitoxin system RelE/ParE family toxin [Thioalkalivibrio denitrificans]OOG21464.1 addiction module toxin RelE [Thioalkalivibrio denitrificans]
MASYRIEWKQSARKELRKLDRPLVSRLLKAIEPLAKEPRPPGSRRLLGSDHTYRIRVGEYRVVYSVLDSILIVQIVAVGHRRQIYRRLP